MKAEVLEQIVECLATGPKSVNEISKELEVGWKTCERYLKSLKSIGIVNEIKSKSENLYVYPRARRAKLLTVPKVRVGTTFELGSPPKPHQVEDLT